MQHMLCELHTLNSALFNRPDIICFEQFSEIVISFSGFHLFNLTVDAVFISRGGNVADNAQGHRETVLIVHHGQFQLQSVVFTVGIMHKNVLLCDAVFA